jgi:hypothetical protein
MIVSGSRRLETWRRMDRREGKGVNLVYCCARPLSSLFSISTKSADNRTTNNTVNREFFEISRSRKLCGDR